MIVIGCSRQLVPPPPSLASGVAPATPVAQPPVEPQRDPEPSRLPDRETNDVMLEILRRTAHATNAGEFLCY